MKYIEKLNPKVGIDKLYKKIMERFTIFSKSENGISFIKNYRKKDSEDQKVKHQENNFNMFFIYDKFKEAIKNLMNKDKYKLGKLLGLISGFIKFTVFFYNGNLEFIDEILEMTTTLIEKHDKESLKKKRTL